MRRLIALIGFLGFANLSFVPSARACALAGGQSHATATDPADDAGHEHAGHEMPGTPVAKTFDPPSDADETAHPRCVMTGPCGLSVDVGRLVPPSHVALHTDGILVRSDRVPPSRTTSPDIPPPKA